MSGGRIAIVGDRSDAVVAHRAIELSLGFARSSLDAVFDWGWVPTRDVDPSLGALKNFSAVWLVPGSPYESMAGALAAVQWARQSGRPFLGTCGGFQHALIEIARNLGGVVDADHEESNPGAANRVITRLSCSLAGATGRIIFEPGSLLERAYGAPSAVEAYQCNYGPDQGMRSLLEAQGLRFTAFDAEGNLRGAELVSHPFFAGVLFQPERAALRGEMAPLVREFARAVSA